MTLYLHRIVLRIAYCIAQAYAISYAVEAWGNYDTKEMENKIDKMFRKAHKWGLSEKKFTFQQLKAQYSERLRHKICSNSNHCLFHLLPPKRDERYDLRPRSHDHQTILASKSLFRKSFIVSTLLDGRYVVNDSISPTKFQLPSSLTLLQPQPAYLIVDRVVCLRLLCMCNVLCLLCMCHILRYIQLQLILLCCQLNRTIVCQFQHSCATSCSVPPEAALVSQGILT